MNIYQKLEKSLLIAVSPKSRNTGGAIIASRPGMGKSSLTRSILKSAGVPFVEYSGKLSAQQCYEFCMEHQSQIILLDDISEEMLESAVSIAKSLLGRDKDGEPLVCSYRNNQVNHSFRFTGRLLLLTNSSFSADEVNAHLAAVLDRMILINLDLSHSQILEKIEELARGTTDITEIDKQRILCAIRRYSNPLSRTFSLRVWGKCVDAFRNFPDGWESWVKELLEEPSSDIELVAKITREHSSKTVGQQYQVFRELASSAGCRGKSERYFYSVKRKAREMGCI